MKKQLNSYGYYSISMMLFDSEKLLHTNNERAFIISCLQDLLTPRLFVNNTFEHKQFASCLDLLAFSIRADAVECVVFSIDHAMPVQLVNHLSSRLMQYQDEYGVRNNCTPQTPLCRVKKLRGPHHALSKTISLHLSHIDWEYDRYSSIGFYLHDRRGDWMRTWRLVRLYGGNSLNYLHLLENYIEQKHSPATIRLLAS